ncbi:hypothetical protein [Streptosporangium sp. NPDC049304]|uniref:hypothetical protein n=1 Tax=Streptosporangium sp. NPDC049304 TaxID=3154830 RepID=UPI003430498A
MWRLPGLDALPVAERQRAWFDVGGHPRTLEYLDALLRGGRARFDDVRERLEDLLDRRGIPDPGEWLRAAGSGLDAALAEAVTLAVDDTLLGELVGSLDDLSRALLVGASAFRVAVDRVGVTWPVSTPVPEDPERLERLDELLRRAWERNPRAGVEDLGLAEEELEQAREDMAQERGEFERALEHYHRALIINQELGNRAGMAGGYGQISILYTKTGRAAEAVAFTVRGLLICAELRSPEIRIDLYWLGRQREALGEVEFRRLLAEHLDAQAVDTVIGWLDQSNE